MRLTPFADEPAPCLSSQLAPRVLLEIRRGAARHKVRPVSGPLYLIGRSAECDLVLADPQFPDIYAYLRIAEGRVLLRHLGVGPEITVDGRPVEAAELLDGDRLRTGPYEFRVHVDSSPDGPDGQYAENYKPQLVQPMRVVRETPLELVRALLTDVRARLAGTEPETASQRRDAA